MTEAPPLPQSALFVRIEPREHPNARQHFDYCSTTRFCLKCLHAVDDQKHINLWSQYVVLDIQLPLATQQYNSAVSRMHKAGITFHTTLARRRQHSWSNLSCWNHLISASSQVRQNECHFVYRYVPSLFFVYLCLYWSFTNSTVAQLAMTTQLDSGKLCQEYARERSSTRSLKSIDYVSLQIRNIWQLLDDM